MLSSFIYMYIKETGNICPDDMEIQTQSTLEYKVNEQSLLSSLCSNPMNP